MRYIGNKTRLLDFIRRVLRSRGIAGGLAIDPFTGTASVARALKRWGFEVVASDVMEYAHVFGRAYVQLEQRPRFGALAGELGLRREPELRDVVAYLNGLAGEPGFLTTNFTPASPVGRRHERMYFLPENSARIDAIRSMLERWRRDGALEDDGYYVLLASLLHAADKVANTAGVYAACIKSWQPNARRSLRLRVPRLTLGSGGRAVRAEALELVSSHEPFELLYIDPPYNTRQYPAYYHIPELIAMGWFTGPVELRGKAGLLADREKRSDWSKLSRCRDALESLVAAAPCRHIVMSYNAEGIIPEETIERVFKNYGRRSTYRRYTRRYRRYRSDTDSDQRSYRGDVVAEHLYCVER